MRSHRYLSHALTSHSFPFAFPTFFRYQSFSGLGAADLGKRGGDIASDLEVADCRFCKMLCLWRHSVKPPKKAEGVLVAQLGGVGTGTTD